MRSKNALKNVISSIILQVVQIIIGFIIPRLIIESFGSNSNGLISSIKQFLTYITLLESGFGPVVKSLLYKPIAKKDKKEIENILCASEQFFRKIAHIFIVYIMALLIIYPFFVKDSFTRIFTMSMIIIMSFGTFSEYFFGITYRLYLQAEQKTYIGSYIQIFTALFNGIIIFVMIKLGCNLILVQIGSALTFILRPIVQNIYVKKKYKINLSNADKNYSIKNKWEGLAQHIAAVIHGNTDIMVLTIFSTIEEVSVYSVYLLVINGIKYIVSAFDTGIDASFGDMIAKNEQANLNRKFSSYEFIYQSIITIIFICTFILLIPFIKVYTNGINDANYIRPIFSIIILIAEFLWAIRLPYLSLTMAAGHFKETQMGAWIEAILNISISICLVCKLGIIGVAIGTLIAMAVRTIEFIYHTSKYILQRKMKKSFFKLLVILIESMILVCIANKITIDVNTCLSWVKYAIPIFFGVTAIVILVNSIVYKDDAKEAFNILISNLIKRKTITNK